MLNERAKARRDFFNSNYDYFIFENKMIYTQDTFLDYFLSFSTVPIENINNRNSDYCREILYTFSKLSSNGKLEILFNIEVYSSQIIK